MDPRVLATVAFVVLMVMATGWDVTRRRIPNPLVLMGLLAGLALRVPGGWGPLASGLAGAGLAFAITFPLFMLRGLGGGDVKLFAAVGAFMGPSGFISALVGSAIVGCVLAV